MIKLKTEMNGVTPIPAAIRTTRLCIRIDSIGLGNGPSKLNISFLGAGAFFFCFRDFRLDFSACFKILETLWYNSPVQSPRFEIASVKVVRFGSTTKSITVNGCHSRVDKFSH